MPKIPPGWSFWFFLGASKMVIKIDDRGVHSTILFVWSCEFFLCVWTVHVGVCYWNSTFWLDFLGGSKFLRYIMTWSFFATCDGGCFQGSIARIERVAESGDCLGLGLFDDFVQKKKPMDSENRLSPLKKSVKFSHLREPIFFIW